jgi:ParB family chromosome partitioning protein
MVKKGLGSGLDALFGGKPILDDIPAVKVDKNEKTELNGEVVQLLPLAKVQPNPKQPRRVFDEDKLAELSQSIREQGVLQPILVRPTGKNWQIVAGERRYKAALLAGLKQIPCIVRELSDNATLEIALIENIQRQNLNPLEEAASYQELLDKFGYTQQELGEKLGKSRVYIANTLRLLALPKASRQALGSGQISAGHGRAILQLGDDGDRELLTERIIKEHLSVREAERIAKQPRLLHKKSATAAKKTSVSSGGDLILKELGARLQNKLGTKVVVQKAGPGGKIQIEYYSDDDLERLIETLLPGESF